MTTLSRPSHCAPLAPRLAYVDRATATRQAAAWNLCLADDPDFGPKTGFHVGVGPRVARVVGPRWPLVWVANAASDVCALNAARGRDAHALGVIRSVLLSARSLLAAQSRTNLWELPHAP